MNSFFLQFWGAFLEDQRWILSCFQDSQLRGYEVKTAKKSIVNLYIYIFIAGHLGYLGRSYCFLLPLSLRGSR